MEFLNSIELRGIVGIARQHASSDKVSLTFSLLTEYAYKDDGCAQVIETTWFNVSVCIDKDEAASLHLGKGAHVYVKGRLRLRHYLDAIGTPRALPEVVAHLVKLEPWNSGVV